MEASEETHRQQFQAKKGPGTFSSCRLGQLLLDTATKWLHPTERLPEEILGQIVLEQFMSDLEGEVRDWVRCHNPQTLDETVGLAEDFVEAERQSH